MFTGRILDMLTLLSALVFSAPGLTGPFGVLGQNGKYEYRCVYDSETAGFGAPFFEHAGELSFSSKDSAAELTLNVLRITELRDRDGTSPNARGRTFEKRDSKSRKWQLSGQVLTQASTPIAVPKDVNESVTSYIMFAFCLAKVKQPPAVPGTYLLSRADEGGEIMLKTVSGNVVSDRAASGDAIGENTPLTWTGEVWYKEADNELRPTRITVTPRAGSVVDIQLGLGRVFLNGDKRTFDARITLTLIPPK